MQRRFRDRAELIKYICQQFPYATKIDGHPSETRGGRQAAEATLAKVDPARYASTRNYLDGAVTRLSPYLRHGVLSLAEVRRFALGKASNPQKATKLINELGWRDYFQRVYYELAGDIWHDLEEYKTGHQPKDYAQELPEDIREGTTGLDCIDAFSRELRETGYLHNHVRMWLAAYVVHWRKVRWQAGARWFLTHLLDGDPASNNLSWQWVASTFSHKPYIFNRQNLERFTNNAHCKECPLNGSCELDADYDLLTRHLFPHLPADDGQPTALVRQNQQNAPKQKSPRQRLSNTEFDYDVDRDQLSDPQRNSPIIWIHGDSLSPYNPAFQAFPDVPAIWVWDDALLKKGKISLKRILFLYECLLELPVTICRGDVAEEVLGFVASNRANGVVTTDSPSPRFDTIFNKIEDSVPVTVLPVEPFVRYEQKLDLRRFSRYWRKVERMALGK